MSDESSQGEMNGRGGATLAALMARAEALGGGAAPVERWHPPDCGAIPMRIAADGTWHYAGTPILREPMVRLFARILRREPDGRFVLLTPHEMVGIAVDDAPFVGVEVAAEAAGTEHQVVVVRTNVGDVARIGPAHPVRFATEDGTGGLVPYVLVRGGLEAKLTRPAALDLADLVDFHTGHAALLSGGARYKLPSSPEPQR